MSGYTLSHRDKWLNPVFRNLLEAGIWSWMCDTAAWKETKIRFSGKLISLKRGQLVTSERFISEGFGIGRQTVRTFLDNLQADHMITREITQSSTIITICNYDKYQAEDSYDQPNDKPELQPPSNPPLTHGQPTGNPNKKEGNEYNKDNIDDCSAGEREKTNQKIREIYAWLEKFFQLVAPLPSAPISAWIEWGADLELDIIPSAEIQKMKYPQGSPRSLKWLDEKIAASIKQRSAPMPETRERASPRRDYGQEATDKNDRILQELLRQQAENETDSSDSGDSRTDD